MRLKPALASITSVAAGLTCVAALLAQTPPAPQEQRPTFKGGANLVRVDVSVIDRHGELVTDLTKDDFEIREDGVPQTVENFKLVEASGEAPDDLSLPIRSPEHALAEAARDDVRVFVIFWDEYHIGQMAAAIEGRKALTEFVHNAFGPADLVALVDQLTPLDAIKFTRDRLELTEAVRKLKGRLGIYIPPRSALEEGQMALMRDVEQLRAQVTGSALEAVISHLGAIREGRKAILFVSQDIGALPRDERYRWLDGAIRLANTNNTVIYTLDPRGLLMNGRISDVLQSLASETGGRWFQSNEPAPLLRTIVKESRAFYLLGYASTLNPADGRFHHIKVHVKRPGVDVHARNGYFAPAPTQIENERTRVAAAVVPPDVERALSPLVAMRPDTVGDLWVGATDRVDGAGGERRRGGGGAGERRGWDDLLRWRRPCDRRDVHRAAGTVIDSADAARCGRSGRRSRDIDVRRAGFRRRAVHELTSADACPQRPGASLAHDGRVGGAVCGTRLRSYRSPRGPLLGVWRGIRRRDGHGESPQPQGNRVVLPAAFTCDRPAGRVCGAVSALLGLARRLPDRDRSVARRRSREGAGALPCFAIIHVVASGFSRKTPMPGLKTRAYIRLSKGRPTSECDRCYVHLPC